MALPAPRPAQTKGRLFAETARGRASQGVARVRQLHKTIVSDKGRAVFNGLINVAQHAIKTDGQMTNNNLLLNTLTFQIDPVPQGNR